MRRRSRAPLFQIPAGPSRSAVNLRLQHADVGQVPVLLAVVQSVAHHELVRNLKAHVVGGDGLGPAAGLVQQRTHSHGGRPLGEEVLLEKVQGISGVQDVLNHNQIPARDILLDVVSDLHRAGGAGGVAVGGHGDELHVALYRAGPDNVRHEDEGPPQHADKEGVLALQIPVHLRTHGLDPGGNLLFGVQYLQNVLIHCTHVVHPPSFFCNTAYILFSQSCVLLCFPTPYG